MNKFYQQLTLVGEIIEVDPSKGCFSIRLLSEDIVQAWPGRETFYQVLANLDNLNRDRVVSPEANDKESDLTYKLRKYVRPGLMACVQGIASINGDTQRLDARTVTLMHSTPGKVAWEDTHWWVSQVTTMCNQWLDAVFGNKRTFTTDDLMEYYRTNLNILGQPTTDPIQECATLSRFLYGLSSAFLLTGITRFYSAAKATADYLCDTFRSPSHDQTYCFWKFGRRSKPFNDDITPSQNADDLGAYALYEQIYALAGLAQFYRISQDRRIRDYIQRTISGFQDFYHDNLRKDRPDDPCFTGKGGYFSHLDPITMRPDTDSLGQNRMKKNWNSIGDHIPAYLINLLLAIDPLPEQNENWEKLRLTCWNILDECVDNILLHFPERSGDPRKPDGTLNFDNITNDYVRERYNFDWSPDTTWSWQKDRAICGHNLKIAWNLTRCGHYYSYRNTVLEKQGYHEEAVKNGNRARDCYDYAAFLGGKMAEVGVDLARGGIFDAVERKPGNNMPTEFVWGSTKDFWQQEQAILAYLILYGVKGDKKFLELARYCNAFWNLFFLDRDSHRIRFRTSESGAPIVEGTYGNQGGHAIAGYHSFELCYLAHIYTRCYVPSGDDNFVIYFRPNKTDEVATINVLPDFLRVDEVEIVRVKVNGREIEGLRQNQFQIALSTYPADSTFAVEFRPLRVGAETREEIKRKRPSDLTFRSNAQTV
jgi:hypothetical protein